MIIKPFFENKIFAFIIALSISILFLYLTVFNGSCIFNLIPFEIHEAFDPGGLAESTFIRLFDTLISLLIFILTYRSLLKFKIFHKTSRKGLNKYGGMTVNERLYVSGLFDEFHKALDRKDVETAISILRKVDLTDENINPILEGLGLKSKS